MNELTMRFKTIERFIVYNVVYFLIVFIRYDAIKSETKLVDLSLLYLWGLAIFILYEILLVILRRIFKNPAEK